MNMPVNVLVLTSSKTVSGPIKGVLQLVENVDPEKYKLLLYTFRYDGEEDTLFMTSMRDKNIPLFLINQNKNNYFKSISLLCDEIRNKKIDIIQTHGFHPTAMGFFVKLITKVKFICFMHGATYENMKVRLYNLIDNILQLGADKTVLVSHLQRKLVYGGSSKSRVCVLHNAVNLDSPMPVSDCNVSCRKLLGISDNDSVVVTVGRFSPEKGMDVLIKAFALLCKDRSDIHLVVVGDGQERASIEKMIAELGLQMLVHLVGYTQTPGDYVRGADLLVLPSRSEGIPNAVLEAMAFGIPVVATSVGGVPEVIVDGRDGLLVPPDDPIKLAESIAVVLSDFELAARLAAAGRVRMQEAFSVGSRIQKIQMLYSELMPRVHQ